MVILLLHIPLFLIVRWPQGSTPTIFYTKPSGIVDFLLINDQGRFILNLRGTRKIKRHVGNVTQKA